MPLFGCSDCCLVVIRMYYCLRRPLLLLPLLRALQALSSMWGIWRACFVELFGVVLTVFGRKSTLVVNYLMNQQRRYGLTFSSAAKIVQLLRSFCFALSSAILSNISTRDCWTIAMLSGARQSWTLGRFFETQPNPKFSHPTNPTHGIFYLTQGNPSPTLGN